MITFGQLLRVSSVRSIPRTPKAFRLALTSDSVTPIANEFKPSRPPLLTLSQNIGLLAGAVFWGFGKYDNEFSFT
jgi:hypothetical protein